MPPRVTGTDCDTGMLLAAETDSGTPLAPLVPVRTTVKPYTLADANQALDDLRAGKLEGAAVLVPGRARATRRDGLARFILPQNIADNGLAVMCIFGGLIQGIVAAAAASQTPAGSVGRSRCREERAVLPGYCTALSGQPVSSR